MQKSKRNLKKKTLLFILAISIFIIIPSLLASIQKEIEFEEKNPYKIENKQSPKVSNVYYESTTSYARGIYVSGDYAYIADHASGLAVIDISDPTNPGLPIYEDTTGYASDVYVSGNYAYLVGTSPGLVVIDISDPTNPGLPIYEDTTTSPYDVYVSGNYAYMAASTSGLAVIDISDPTNPGLPVYESTTGSASGVYVSGDYAYVTNSYSGLAIIDISEPTNPGAPVYEDTTGSARDVYVSGDYAYVADGTSGLAVIDISDPTNPGTPVYEDTTGTASGVYVSGDYAYVADGSSGLATIDISDPTNPQMLLYEDTIGIANDVYVSGCYAYVADENGLAVIEVSDPISLGTPIYEDTADYASGVYVSGDYAYVADGTSGLAVIDISDPTNPGPTFYEDTTGTASGVYVSGDYAYLAAGYSGLAIIDISDPTNPGTPVYEDTINAYGVYVSGDYAYVANSDVLGLWVIDISDPTNLALADVQQGGMTGIHVSGDYAYAVGNQFLRVFDVSDPFGAGASISSEATTGTARDIYVSGDYAYIADDASGLAVIDISDPTNPGLPIYEDTADYARGVYVSGNYAYIADEASGLAVIDISDPTNPGTPIFEDTTGSARDIYVSGDYAYVADGISGLAVIQVRQIVDKVNPEITDLPSDLSVEYGYTGQSLSWTATDPNPNTYTIELQGSGIVDGPIVWMSGSATTYNIPDGLSIASYIYTVNFTDNQGNFVTDSVNFEVGEDTSNPTITSAPSDFILEFGYTGESLSWTATDPNPNTYTIELQTSGIVHGPISWTSGGIITYNIPNGFPLGVYTYTVNFTDDYGNSIVDSVILTIDDTIAPIITINSPDTNDEFGTTAPAYVISINEPHLDQIWYTLDEGITTIKNIPLTGSIDQSVWDSLPSGSVTLTFYANDTSGNIVVKSVNIVKLSSGEGEPDLLRTIATILSIIGGTFTVLGIFYRAIYVGRVKPKKWAKDLESSRDEKIRFHAASKLKKSKSTKNEVISALKKATSDSSGEIRILAKEALKEKGIFVND